MLSCKESIFSIRYLPSTVASKVKDSLNSKFLSDFFEISQRCKGLILLETYTALEGIKLNESLPDFLNIVKPVTGNPDYSMYNLSLREDWKTSKKFCKFPVGVLNISCIN